MGNRHATDYHFTALCRTISAGQTSPPPAGNLHSHSNYTNWIVCFSFTVIHNSELTPISTTFRISKILTFFLLNFFKLRSLPHKTYINKPIALGLIYHLALVSVRKPGNQLFRWIGGNHPKSPVLLLYYLKPLNMSTTPQVRWIPSDIPLVNCVYTCLCKAYTLFIH